MRKPILEPRSIQMADPLRLKANNCKAFDVEIVLAAGDFLQDLFLKAMPSELKLGDVFKEQRHLNVTCNRRGKDIDYAASVVIYPFEGEAQSAEVHIHVVLRPTRALKKKEEPPPFAEEIFQWLGSFVSKQAEIEIRERGIFTFPTMGYRSAFSLPLKLSGATNPVENDVFEGSEMVGIRVKLPSNKADVRVARQTVFDEFIRVELQRKVAATNPQKLMSIEQDVPVLSKIASATVKRNPLKRR